MKNIVRDYLWIACCYLIAMLPFAANGTTNAMVVSKVDVLSEFGDEGIDNNKQIDKHATASVYTISGEELLTGRSTSLMGALQGKLPGMRIMQTSGAPGQETFAVQVRGVDSPSASPVLILVDGIERNTAEIDLNDVESVTVLKDGAATAIYGMRGSAGVILVKTKRGFIGKSDIKVSYDQAVISPTRLPKFVSAYDYANMYNQRQANDTLYSDMQDIAVGGSGIDHRGVPFYSPFEIERYKLGDMMEFFPVRNMLDEFTNDFSMLSRVNMNFQGGNTAMRYFTSVGFQQQGGLFETEPFERYSYDAQNKAVRFNFRTNLDLSLNNTLDMWVNIAGSMSKINSPFVGSGMGYADVLAKLYETPNNAHNDLTPDGEVLVRRDRITFRNTQSVYGLLNRTGSSNQTNTRMGTNFGVRQQLDVLTTGLSASGQLAFDVYSRSNLNRSRSYQAFEVARFTNINGLDSLGYSEIPGSANTGLSDGQGRYFDYMYDMYVGLDYQRYFNLKHSINASLRAENNILQMEDLLSRYYMGLAGRVAYAYNKRYLAEANFAYQGSEQFAKGNRFGFFPSLALGWVVSEESFLADNATFNFLKLRASLGQSGNTGFNYGAANQFLYITRWNANATENQIGNEDLTFETTTKFNVAVETGLFDSFYFIADYFYHKTTDILIFDIATLPYGIIGIGNASLPPANVGEVENKGFELVAGYSKQLSSDFSMNVNGNVSFSENIQLYMAEMAYDDTYAYPYRRQGYPTNNFFGYKTDGLFSSQQEINDWANQSALGGHPIPGDIKYLDLNNDGVIDEKDRAPLASGQQPDVVYGLSAQANYKWFDLNVYINGAARRNVYLNNYGRWSNRDNFTEYMKNAWTQELAASGQPVQYPRLASSSTNHILSDYWIADGSFVRLRNIEIGYTVPVNLSKRINASSIRLYANGLNLLVWDKLPNKDFDPETASSNNSAYPLTKSFIFGASVKF